MSLRALLIFASPIPQTFGPGDVALARPRHFDYPLPNTENNGKHPVVVLTHPDAHGFVKVATVSHTHPYDPPTKPASTYGIKPDPKKGDSKINVASPQRIPVHKLSPLPIPDRLHPTHLAALKKEILKNCPDVVLHRRDPTGSKPDPCDREAVQAQAKKDQADHEAEHGKVTKKRSSGHKSNRNKNNQQTASHASGSGHTLGSGHTPGSGHVSHSGHK